MATRLPSESPRRRRLLYMSEGLTLGAAAAYILAYLVGTLLWFTESTFTLAIVVVGLIFLLVVLRNIGISWRVINEGQQTRSPVQEDWAETRQWGWVASIAVLVGGVVLALSVSVWGWKEVIYLNAAVWVCVPAVLIGLGFWAYGLSG